jgi:hypothetical protein
MWDETLVFDDVVIYGIRDDLLQRPPVVIVEIYDYDLVVSFVLLRYNFEAWRGRSQTVKESNGNLPAPRQYEVSAN